MNPAGWPHELLEVFAGSVTAEYASLTRSGTPVTIPTTPYFGDGGDTLDISTGLTYPAKAERARRDPRVCLLFADPIGAPRTELPVVLVQGLATVRDSDLQQNTDRYVRLSTTKLPDAAKAPRAALRRMAWYYARIWVEVTPLHIRWWPNRDLEVPASTWNAPEGTAAQLSDPAPTGARPGAWIDPPGSWRAVAQNAIEGSLIDVTVVDENGFPICLPVRSAELGATGFDLRLGPAAPALSSGPACLTMHRHGETFTGQENHSFVGTMEPASSGLHMNVERALGDWSLPGSRSRVALGVMSKRRVLSKRLATECLRRAQPVPMVRFGD